MVSQDRAKISKQANQDRDIGQVIKRLDMLDERLDNIDSMVSAVIERVMNQALTISASCPHCNHNFEVALIGVRKPKL